MDAFTTHTGIGVPLRRGNVDTDQIIPAEYLKRVTRTGFEDGLFAAWRGDRDLRPEQPAVRRRLGPGGRARLRHRLVPRARGLGADELRLQGRHLLALRRHLPRQQRQGGAADGAGRDQEDVELLWKLLETEPGTEVTVDLRSRTITAKDIVAPFQVDDYIRWRLLEGLDDIGLTLRHEAEVTAYEASRPAWKPTVTAG